MYYLADSNGKKCIYEDRDAAALWPAPVNLELHDYSGTTSTSTSVPHLTVATTMAA
ncbi:hypothetical protein [Paenibacillus yonginensis]|uniref:hypothetical protein n=1 Tax=Paenibacillus yonginensis TaxID=1462996 RepID=UPI001470F0E4|nr:hypothetical protein [Paenibacillus yonginensis]